MKFNEFYLLKEVQQIGYQEVEKNQLFGPVYHGTTEENMASVLQNGFRIQMTLPRTDGTRHGYTFDEYTGGLPMPIHHLGFGVYFTTVKSIAKNYNLGTSKGLKPFYLNVPRLETINFGSPVTMMKWWIKNGYNMPPLAELREKSQAEINKLWINATKNLTETLKAQFDGVWFKGKSIYSLLDGDQVCVYDPARIYMLNTDLNLKDTFLVGDRVKIKGVSISTVILSQRKIMPTTWGNQLDKFLKSESEFMYSVKLTASDIQKIQSVYLEPFYHFLISSPECREFLQMRVVNTGDSLEGTAKKYADYVFGSSLKLNFPQSLIEKKLKRGERT